MNNKIINLFFFVGFFLTVNCSFDNTNKSRIWSGGEDEKKKALDIFSEQNKELVNIYSSSKATLEEVKPIKNITLNSPKKNNSWRMEGQNLQNLTGNIYLTGINNNFLKKTP